MWEPDILGGPWLSQKILLPSIRGHETFATVVSQARWLTTPQGTPITSDIPEIGGDIGVSEFAAESNGDQHLTEPTVRGTEPTVRGTEPTVRARSESTAVLYVHGLNDYFFHTHVAAHIESLGLAFFALDLHGFGRSTGHELTRNDALNLREYGNDLARATSLIKEACGYENLVILAHSTGGLIASLWAHSSTGRRTVDGLILNSPWFDLNRSWFDRTVGTAVVDAVGGYVSDMVLDNNESNYVRMLHKDIAGEWDFDLDLKREVHSPVRAGFFRAVREGQARLAQGLGLSCPVLVCTSDRTGHPADPVAVKRSSDVVLDVQQIITRAPLLGAHVEVAQIPGGIHDLALSEYGPRMDYLQTVSHWLQEHGFSKRTI